MTAYEPFLKSRKTRSGYRYFVPRNLRKGFWVKLKYAICFTYFWNRSGTMTSAKLMLRLRADGWNFVPGADPLTTVATHPKMTSLRITFILPPENTDAS